MYIKVIFSLFAILVWSVGRVDSAYTEIHNCSEMFEKLVLTSTERAHLSEHLGGLDLDNISTLDPLERSSIACAIASVVFSSKFIDQSAFGYQNVVEVNW